MHLDTQQVEVCTTEIRKHYQKKLYVKCFPFIAMETYSMPVLTFNLTTCSKLPLKDLMARVHCRTLSHLFRERSFD